MSDIKQYPPVQIAFEQFGEVSKLAAIQELRIRLLANKTESIEDAAYEHSVAATNAKVIEHFKSINAISESEIDLLLKSQTIRNKIFHGEFNEAVKRIEALLGAPAPGPTVKAIKVPKNSSGKQLLDLIFASQKAIAEGTVGPQEDVSQMGHGEAGIFGELLNCVQSGAMKMAYNIFIESNKLLDRLMAIEDANSK